ncbi:MAG: Smr/MutS family protein [Thermoanaerobaculia bacterium]|nr:Smr/MutS family protein [Thermoanaerobaculia bacterium]
MTRNGDAPDRLLDEEPEAVRLEVTDVLDLHTFAPSEIGSLVRDYLDLAIEKGYREIRIIHGKGMGVQRDRVRKILAADRRVIRFGDALDPSSWGATIAQLIDGESG